MCSKRATTDCETSLKHFIMVIQTHSPTQGKKNKLPLTDQEASQFPPPHSKQFTTFWCNKHAEAFTQSSLQAQLKDPAGTMLVE